MRVRTHTLAKLPNGEHLVLASLRLQHVRDGYANYRLTVLRVRRRDRIAGALVALYALAKAVTR